MPVKKQRLNFDGNGKIKLVDKSVSDLPVVMECELQGLDRATAYYKIKHKIKPRKTYFLCSLHMGFDG